MKERNACSPFQTKGVEYSNRRWVRKRVRERVLLLSQQVQRERKILGFKLRVREGEGRDAAAEEKKTFSHKLLYSTPIRSANRRKRVESLDYDWPLLQRWTESLRCRRSYGQPWLAEGDLGTQRQKKRQCGTGSRQWMQGERSWLRRKGASALGTRDLKR